MARRLRAGDAGAVVVRLGSGPRLERPSPALALLRTRGARPLALGGQAQDERGHGGRRDSRRRQEAAVLLVGEPGRPALAALAAPRTHGGRRPGALRPRPLLGQRLPLDARDRPDLQRASRRRQVKVLLARKLATPADPGVRRARLPSLRLLLRRPRRRPPRPPRHPGHRRRHPSRRHLRQRPGDHRDAGQALRPDRPLVPGRPRHPVPRLQAQLVRGRRPRPLPRPLAPRPRPRRSRRRRRRRLHRPPPDVRPRRRSRRLPRRATRPAPQGARRRRPHHRPPQEAIQAPPGRLLGVGLRHARRVRRHRAPLRRDPPRHRTQTPPRFRAPSPPHPHLLPAHAQLLPPTRALQPDRRPLRVDRPLPHRGPQAPLDRDRRSSRPGSCPLGHHPPPTHQRGQPQIPSSLPPPAIPIRPLADPYADPEARPGEPHPLSPSRTAPSVSRRPRRTDLPAPGLTPGQPLTPPPHARRLSEEAPRRLTPFR
mmetsp:Transcript_3666/g.11286  ORF Transcript_3666/g.11286 Transcript_3666/m.11286 type:complete len:483 (+) Transcript_3666:474-1922(+)